MCGGKGQQIDDMLTLVAAAPVACVATTAYAYPTLHSRYFRTFSMVNSKNANHVQTAAGCVNSRLPAL